MFKKTLSALAALAMVGLGAVTLAAPASAHTNSVSATCSTLSVDLQNYAPSQGAQEATYKTVPNPDYVPAVVEVSHTEWKYSEHHGDGFIWVSNDTFKYVDEHGVGYDHKPSHETYYERTQDTKKVVTTEASPAIGNPTIQVVDRPAVDSKTNHVVVTIDGTKVEDTNFSTTFTKDYPFSDQYTAHTYSVVVTAWDDPTGEHGWTFTKTGTSIACTPPIVPSTCSASTVLPASTNLEPRGWVLKHDAKYVDGGIELTSAGGANGHGGVIYKDVNFKLADAANLGRDLTVTSGGGSSFAIEMDTSDGATVTYEPAYSDLLWTDTPGILPRNNPAPNNNNGQGGPYSGNLSQLLSNPTIVDVWIGIWNTDEVAVLHSVSFDCQTQPFTYQRPIPVQPEPKVVTSDWTSGTIPCDATTVEQTRTVTTTPYVWDAESWSWVLDTENAVVTPETQTIDVPKDEQTICPTGITPKAPTIATTPTCSTDYVIVPGTYSIPEQTGVVYTIDGTAVQAGVYNLTASTTVVATLADSKANVWTKDAVTSWTLVPAANPTCTKPVVTPPVVVPPVADVSVAAPTTLAYTGANPVPWGIAALVLVGSGALMRIWSSRKAASARR